MGFRRRCSGDEFGESGVQSVLIIQPIFDGDSRSVKRIHGAWTDGKLCSKDPGQGCMADSKSGGGNVAQSELIRKSIDSGKRNFV